MVTKDIAQKIFDLRSEQKRLNSAEKEETAKLREITGKIAGVCKFEIVASCNIDWKAVAEALFLQYGIGDAEKNALIDANTKKSSYETLTFEKSYGNEGNFR